VEDFLIIFELKVNKSMVYVLVRGNMGFEKESQEVIIDRQE
jgi:hypothetical protein